MTLSFSANFCLLSTATKKSKKNKKVLISALSFLILFVKTFQFWKILGEIEQSNIIFKKIKDFQSKCQFSETSYNAAKFLIILIQ